MLNDWRVQELEERLVLKKKTSQVTLPEIEIIIDDSLGFTIYVYEWLLPETHELYTTNLRSITNITVSDLVKSINTLSITIWLVKQCRASCNSKVGWSLFCQWWWWWQFISTPRILQNSWLCSFFFGQGAEQCCSFHVSHRLRITLTVQMQRLKYAELVQKLEEMKLEIQKSSVGVDHQMSQDITSILGKSDKKVTPFTCMHGFIWQQQKNLLTRSSTGVRYHPMISRYCLSLAAKSPVYYDELCK